MYYTRPFRLYPTPIAIYKTQLFNNICSLTYTRHYIYGKSAIHKISQRLCECMCSAIKRYGPKNNKFLLIYDNKFNNFIYTSFLRIIPLHNTFSKRTHYIRVHGRHLFLKRRFIIFFIYVMQPAICVVWVLVVSNGKL